MKKISAKSFKARCLSVVEDVRKTRNPVVITQRGVPVAKLIPVGRGRDNFLGRLEGIVRITGDIELPLEPAESWGALTAKIRK